MGPNGVGKTTLMRRIGARFTRLPLALLSIFHLLSHYLSRIAAEAVPGWPLHLSTLYVQQEVLATSSTVMETMLEGVRKQGEELEEEKQQLEAQLGDGDPVAGDSTPADVLVLEAMADDVLEAMADRLGEIYEQLESLQSDSKMEEAAEILKGLQFTAGM
jgi:ATPase subunit of ABC transporter with duplicated ATPase domains